MKSSKQNWRNAATLIVLAKQFRGGLTGHVPKATDFDILLQTRTQAASTFPNSVVFPGGVTEALDESDRWRRHLSSFGFGADHFRALHSPAAPLTPILRDDPVTRHISLRITAIRETFEELGILIGSRAHCANRKHNWASIISDFDTVSWQRKVSEDPEQLLALCEELKCYPDIWALHYWSNWLTPTVYEKRFDTAFFVTAFKEHTEVVSNTEVAEVKWSSIDEIFEQHQSKEINLNAPQLYELHRLSTFENIENLIEFASDRSKYGSELFFPFIIRAKDGVVHVLPGDDLYPSDIDFNNGLVNRKDKTLSDLREGCERFHRLETSKTSSVFVWKNYKPQHHINMCSEAVNIHP